MELPPNNDIQAVEDLGDTAVTDPVASLKDTLKLELQMEDEGDDVGDGENDIERGEVSEA